MRYWIVLLFSCYSMTIQAEVVTLVSRGDANADYAIQLMKQALSKAERRYQFEIIEEAWAEMRSREALLSGQIDVTWTATSSDMEEGLLPVRIPLYKGLLGYRILIIHRDNRHLFAGVRTMEDLQNFTFCQGRMWTDTQILQSNDLTVVPATKYEGLFYMVDGGRCDAFPRGVHEPWDELARRPELELAVDENIMLEYRMPFYLFVSPLKPQLARDLERGLRQMIASGEFDEYFYANPTVQDVMNKSGMDRRRVFPLRNPDLPRATPLDDASLWYDPTSM